MDKGIFDKYRQLKFTFIEVQSNKAPLRKEWQHTQLDDIDYSEDTLYGVMPPEGWITVDIDVKNGKKGLASWSKFLKDHYPESLHQQFEKPNVTTPSGGMHYYISLDKNIRHAKIKKIQKRYPDIDFITHGVSQSIAGGQRLDNGVYTFHNLKKYPSIKSLTHLEFTETKENEDSIGVLTHLTTDQIDRLLRCITKDPYDNWIRIAWALMNSCLSLPQANQRFHDWSSQFPSYDPDKCESRWRQLVTSNKGRMSKKLSDLGLYYIALDCVPQGMSRIEWSTHVKEIYTPSDNLDIIYYYSQRWIIDMSESKQAKIYDLETKGMVTMGFVKRTINDLIPSLCSFYGVKSINNTTLEQQGFIRHAHGRCYMPSILQKVIYDVSGQVFINTFDKDSIPLSEPYTDNDKESIKYQQLYLFLFHVKQVYGVYFNDFLNYFCYLARNPGKKNRYCLVIIGNNSIGKSLLFNIIKKNVLGSDNCEIATNANLTSNFNGFAFDKQLVFLDEFFFNGKTSDFRHYEEMFKVIVTEDEANRNEKNEKARKRFCPASFVCASNHKHCLHEKADPRRYHVIYSPLTDPNHAVHEYNHINKKTLSKEEYFGILGSLADPYEPINGYIRYYFMYDHHLPSDYSPNIRPKYSDFHATRVYSLKSKKQYSKFMLLLELIYNDPRPKKINIRKILYHAQTHIYEPTGHRLFKESISWEFIDSFKNDAGYIAEGDNLILSDDEIRIKEAMLHQLQSTATSEFICLENEATDDY